MKTTKLIFDKSSIAFILEILGKKTNERGFVIDATTEEYELDCDGKKFKASKIIGVTKRDGFLTNTCHLLNLID